jgi:SAM-dependent methyltransferase
VFSRAGVLQLSKRLDTQWQAAALGLYRRVAAELTDSLGYDVFLTYGTLLGVIREGGFIGHDLDFDAAFVAAHHDGPGAARDLQNVAFGLIDMGLAVRASETSLRVWDPAQQSVRLNVFHVYTDGTGAVRFPFGIAGTSTLANWAGSKEIEFGGVGVRVPVEAEAVLEHLYGPGWRTPNPGFSWARDRLPVADADDAALPKAVVEEIYWADFYARTSYTSGSTFFELVNSRDGLPATVIDVGCGDGRDSFAFAAAGRTATGIDRSHVGVRHASRKAEQLGHDQLFFSACDVGDADRLRAALTAARGDDPARPVAFYARFFLHSIPEDVQRTLMSTIAECARPGDYFAAEFRTDRDAAIEKVHGNHYRLFQNGPAFGRSLREDSGFVPLLEQEGNGFSPYKGEDPQLYRVIARREG